MALCSLNRISRPRSYGVRNLLLVIQHQAAWIRPGYLSGKACGRTQLELWLHMESILLFVVSIPILYAPLGVIELSHGIFAVKGEEHFTARGREAAPY